jgi:2-polyprenyl-6-methoxyphenol hydroxylase-like FAD-dependent oxidoreductase
VTYVEAAYDVVVIGFGPSGQVLASQLGMAAHRVGVFDRSPEPYPLPRAGHADDEIVRIFQSIGVAEDFAERAIPAADYEWLDANGQLLFAIDWNKASRSTWRSDYIFYQPYVEETLIAAATNHGNVDVHLGWEAVGMEEFDDHVEVTLREGHRDSGRWEPTGRLHRVSASYVVGADGANSFIRQAAGLTWIDYGFQESLSIVDLRLHDPDMDIDMPDAGQICDPARPVSLFRWLGREHCRWEFMLMPGEKPDDLVSEATSWKMLARWGVTPDNADTIRRTVYTFKSLLADRFGRDRIYVVGDAAHLMPPFLGQGMCSGIRDVTNLAWKLDLVLRGTAKQTLLDTYSSERRAHVEVITLTAMELGRVVCETDPIKAAARDAAFRAGNVPPAEPLPSLGAGVLHRGPDGQPASGAGRLSVQGLVKYRGRTGRFDDVVGHGWILLARKSGLPTHLIDAHRELLAALKVRVVHVTRAVMDDPDAAVDLDGIYARWFRELDADVIIVRPDFYVFGTAASIDCVGELLSSLRQQLQLTGPVT